MIRMEIRILRNFLTVAEWESVTAAADMLHLTQPTLSKQIKALEEELGKKLFIRGSASMRLTAEGELLRSRAADLVDMADRIEREITGLSDVLGGDLYLGLAESWQIRHLAQVIRALKERCPAVRFHITSGDTEQVTGKLDKGLMDFAVLAERPDARKYKSLSFPEEDVWGVVAPTASPLARRETVTAQDLVGLPLFCSGQGWEKDITPWAGELAPSLTLAGSFRLSYNGAIFARERLGYLLTFDHLVDTSPESGLCFRPLSPRCATKLYLVWRRSAAFSPIAERFLAMAAEAFKAKE